MRPAYSSFFVFYVNECTKAGNYGKLFHRNNERMYAHEKGYYKWKNNDYIIMTVSYTHLTLPTNSLV